MTEHGVLIVGGGHAGAQCAIALRQRGFAGPVSVVTDERDFPYERPPLSKDYLANDKPFERILIRPPAFWSERKVEFHFGARIERVDAAARSVTDQSGHVRRFDKLVWAAGGTARRLRCSGHDLDGVHTVRCRADVDRLAAELPTTSKVVVVGGGYIGLEAAAVLRKLGKHVILIEMQDRVLARVAGADLSRFFAAEHRRQGVDLRLSTGVTQLTGERRVTGVELDDGTVVASDMVIVGIGIDPSVAPLIAAGAAGANGVDVDRFGRTSLDHVYAIGDCAIHENAYADGARIRLESVQNANDQAVTVAKHLTGQESPYDEVPWFWSNQYTSKLQTVGLSEGHDEAVYRGDAGTGSFSIVYLRRGRVVALDCVNRTKDFVQGRKLVVQRASIAPALLADTEIPLAAHV